MSKGNSREVAKAAIRMALSTREEEKSLKGEMGGKGLRVAAVDFGGDFSSSIRQIIERSIVASKREGVISSIHTDEGAVAGATREALSQIMPKAQGFDVGGKLGISRKGDHISVAIFFGIGLLHLDEISIGLGHRAVP